MSDFSDNTDQARTKSARPSGPVHLLTQQGRAGSSLLSVHFKPKPPTKGLERFLLSGAKRKWPRVVKTALITHIGSRA